jgi:hypothetical protein
VWALLTQELSILHHLEQLPFTDATTPELPT